MEGCECELEILRRKSSAAWLVCAWRKVELDIPSLGPLVSAQVSCTQLFSSP